MIDHAMNQHISGEAEKGGNTSGSFQSAQPPIIKNDDDAGLSNSHRIMRKDGNQLFLAGAQSSSGKPSEGVSSSKKSENDGTLVQANLFNQRDIGLACFNILEHLNMGKPAARIQQPQQPISTRQETIPAADNRNSVTGQSNFDLQNLRENHIQHMRVNPVINVSKDSSFGTSYNSGSYPSQTVSNNSI